MNRQKLINHRILAFLFICLMAYSASTEAAQYSDTSRFVQGVGKVISAPFHLPVDILKKSFTQMPPIGTLSGVISGTTKTLTSLVGGLWDMAGAAAPYAKYGLFFL